MFRLAMPEEPAWLDLPLGVRVKVRPLTTALQQAASAAARREIERLEAAHRDIVAAGGTVTDLPPIDDPAMREGLAVAALARAYARLCILQWEGVAEADGSPAPLTSANAARLAEHHAIAVALIDGLTRPLEELAREGNG